VRVLKLLVLVGSLFCIQAVFAEVVSDEGASAADQSAQKPSYEKNNDTNFWFEEIEGDHTVYWQFIEVYDTVKESLEKVARRLTKYLKDHRVGKVVSADVDCFNCT
jgi:hypothetical protein